MVNGDQLQKETNILDNPQLSKQGLFIHQRVPFGGLPGKPGRLEDSASEKVPGRADSVHTHTEAPIRTHTHTHRHAPWSSRPTPTCTHTYTGTGENRVPTRPSGAAPH